MPPELTADQRLVLEILAEAYPGALPSVEVAAHADGQAVHGASWAAAMLESLREKGLVIQERGGQIRWIVTDAGRQTANGSKQ